MSADLLREAAAKMRERAQAATPGPWTTDADRPRYITTGENIDVDEADWGPEGHTGYQLGTMQDPRAWKYADVEHIASWHPAVALAVADWLDRLADSVCGRGCDRCAEADLMVLDGAQAITVARTYLGYDA